LQNDNGAVIIPETNGTNAMAAAVSTIPGRHVMGTRLQGRPQNDMLFQNTNGAVAVWQVTGPHILDSTSLGNPGSRLAHLIGRSGSKCRRKPMHQPRLPGLQPHKGIVIKPARTRGPL
jgi:hypothetical protein